MRFDSWASIFTVVFDTNDCSKFMYLKLKSLLFCSFLNLYSGCSNTVLLYSFIANVIIVYLLDNP